MPTSAVAANEGGEVELVGGWLLVLVTASPLIDGVITRFVDHKTIVTDEWGRAVFISPNTMLGTGMRALLLGVICSLAAWLVVRAWRARLLGVSLVPVLALVIVLSNAMHQDVKTADLIRMLGQTVAVLAAGAMPVSRRVLGFLGRYVLLASTSSIVVGIIIPTGSWRECRPDKCSFAGQLLSGFFSHENAFTSSIVIAAPTLAYIASSSWRRVGLLSVVAVVLLSGSRSGMACLAMALLVYPVLMRLRLDEGGTGSVAGARGELYWVRGILAMAPWIPVVVFLASTAVVIMLPTDGLSERGVIYEAVLSGLRDHPVWGGGRSLLSSAFDTGQIGFLVEHEHGQASYILNTTGVIGWLLTLAVLLHVWVAFGDPRRRGLGLLLLAPVALFITEPTMTIGHAGSLYPMMIASAMCSGYPLRSSLNPDPPTGKWV